MRNGAGSPIDFPKVTIGSETLTVKIDLFAELIISRAGLSNDEIIIPFKAGSNDPRSTDLFFRLFAAATANNYKPLGLPVPDADDWVAKVEAAGGDPESNAPILAAMRLAMYQALVKRWPRLRADPAPAAQTSQEAAPKSETPN